MFSSFVTVSFTQADDVSVDNDVVLLKKKDMINITWSPESILPVVKPDNYSVDVHLLEFDVTTKSWKQLKVLGSNIPNTGAAELTVDFPDISAPRPTIQGSISVVVIQVSVSINSIRETQGSVSGILSYISKLNQVGISGPFMYANKVAGTTQRQLCNEWSASQPANIGQEILNRLPPCPRTVAEAETPNSGLKKDNTFIGFFHPEADACFRQRVFDRYGIL